MVLRAALALVPILACAQAPPPVVDQALRARVSEFFQDHVDGNFRKAYELVADDTKDYYFAAQKFQFKSFHIDSIQYYDDFTRADVNVTGDRLWQPRLDFPATVITTPMVTHWKVQNGKWFWTYNPDKEWVVPMGPSDRAAASKPAGSPVPKFDATQLGASARNIMQQSSIDKNLVTLAADKPSSDQVVFHNGQPGSVKVFLQPVPAISGFSAALEKTDLAANENTVLKIHYTPGDTVAPLPAEVNLRLIVQPLGEPFGIKVKFAPPSAH